ncbi:MAG: hypothetical protein ACE366_30570 [Bradymonadia bacterium]
MSRWWCSRSIGVFIGLTMVLSAGAASARKGKKSPKKTPKKAAVEAPVPTGLWGLRLGDPAERVQVAFAPDRGEGIAADPTWTRHESGRITRLEYSCERAKRCRSLPSRASLSFVDDRLAAATLIIDPSSAPRSVNVDRRLAEMERKLELGPPVARAQAVGRLVRYFGIARRTVVWIKDGPDTQIRVALDALNPVPRAEAVAAGAPEESLGPIPGALAYARAQEAVASGAFTAAIDALDQAMASPGVSPLLVEQGRLILAMSLAARVKTSNGVPRSRAHQDLSRARTLAPSLAIHLDEMAKSLKLAPLVKQESP